MSGTPNLLPCPFCNASPRYFYDRTASPVENERHWAMCDGCGAAEPVSTWNRRASTDDLVQALENVTKRLAEFHEFCADPKKPCGEYGAECPISMCEWVTQEEKEELAAALAALSNRRAGEKDNG